MFIYPLVITLILLSLFGRFFEYDKTVFFWTTVVTLPASIFELVNALPENIYNMIGGSSIVAFASKILPFFDLGLGWLCPAILGFVIGISIHCIQKHFVQKRQSHRC